MNLYGCNFDESQMSIQKAAYFCKLISDTQEVANGIAYRTVYRSRGSIQCVLNEALADRAKLYTPVFRYVTAELQNHDIYWYDADRILDTIDMLCGHYIDVCLELYAECCDAAHDYNKGRTLRELRKDSRTRIRAMGSNVPSLIAGMLEAGAINFASGITHSAINAVGNLFARLEYISSLQEIYEAPDTYKRLYNALRLDCIQLPQIIALILYREIGQGWQYPFTQRQLTETKAIINQVKEQLIPSAKRSQLIVDCIVNRAPYYAPLYFFAEQELGDDGGNLFAAAKLFHAREYLAFKEDQARKRNLQHEYEKRIQTLPKEFFGENLPSAKMFLSRSGIDDQIYSRVEDQISPDFNEMIKAILNYRKFVVNGCDKGQIFDRHARSHLVFFEFDFISLIEKQRQKQTYCNMCHVKPDVTAYAFVDTTNTASRSKGFVITDQGFFFSEACKGAAVGQPIRYCEIDSMICGAWDTMKIICAGKDAKIALPPIALLNNFLIFTCMYFKYRSHIGGNKHG